MLDIGFASEAYASDSKSVFRSEELKHDDKREEHTQRRTRLQALWYLCQGKRIEDVVDTGASYSSLQQLLEISHCPENSKMKALPNCAHS